MAAKHYLDPHNAAFAAAIVDEPLPHILGYVKGHEALESLQKSEPASDIVTEVFEVPFEDVSTKVTIFRPKSATGPCPLVYYTHGGGWILGSSKSFAVLMEDLARQTGAAMVFPDYSLAPGKQYPFQFEQTYAILDHVVREGHKYNLLTDRVVLAGDSVGGHFVIALMQMSLERNLPSKIVQLVIKNPVTDTHIKLPSYETYKDGPFLTSDTMDWMIDAFLPNKKDRENALTSPLTFASDQVLAKFPATIILLSDVDPLLDEGRAFGHRLQQAGVDCAIIKAEGQMHAYASIIPLRDNATARAVNELTALKIRKALALQ
ncbi:hypothetical protein PV08_07940 [Exophiala spinifera]|uniref:Alpha/beta hydrolase fold-3 domain-containing protein n=1 Tax=Exophiala spinifera TaxID=91928 RepID=A0A0D2BNP6_9EURO|nr:uncharacterized protein PV08_07940 [Exophiala spinifera]KIW12754.1 hypothetical protein PV08_07940 [Exophiala spinifera]